MKKNLSHHKCTVSIIGIGSFGTSLAYLITSNQHHLKIFENDIKRLNKFQNNTLFADLPNISYYSNLSECVKNTDYVIPCLPSKNLRQFYSQITKHISQKTKVISVSKGLFPNTTETISHHISRYIKPSNFFVLSGPTFAHEILAQHPTRCIIAGQKKLYPSINSLLTNDFFTTEYSSDIIGTELGGILKNCYSITLGMIASHQYGLNTTAMLINSIINEVKPLFEYFHCPKSSVYSLSFLGDLIATGLNPHSRNYSLGFSKKINPHTTSEGYENISPVLKLAKKAKIRLPILSSTKKLLFIQSKDISSLTNTIK